MGTTPVLSTSRRKLTEAQASIQIGAGGFTRRKLTVQLQTRVAVTHPHRLLLLFHPCLCTLPHRESDTGPNTSTAGRLSSLRLNSRRPHTWTLTRCCWLPRTCWEHWVSLCQVLPGRVPGHPGVQEGESQFFPGQTRGPCAVSGRFRVVGARPDLHPQLGSIRTLQRPILCLPQSWARVRAISSRHMQPPSAECHPEMPDFGCLQGGRNLLLRALQEK